MCVDNMLFNLSMFATTNLSTAPSLRIAVDFPAFNRAQGEGELEVAAGLVEGRMGSWNEKMQVRREEKRRVEVGKQRMSKTRKGRALVRLRRYEVSVIKGCAPSSLQLRRCAGGATLQHQRS